MHCLASLVATDMTLWDLLSVFCFSSSIAGAIISAERVKAGFWGHAIAALVALPVAIVCIWAKRMLGYRLHKYIEHRAGRVPQWLYLGMIPIAVFWISASGILGAILASAVLRL